MLPGMKNCAGVVHASPAMGARFVQYTAEFEPGGELGYTCAQRFIFLIDGVLQLDTQNNHDELAQGGYAYVPANVEHKISALQKSRAVIVEKLYKSLAGIEAPVLLVSHENNITSHSLGDDPDLQVKCLLPDEVGFDFAVNTMVYQPGAALSMVEMHIMEHGLLMLEGGGIYRLGDSWYPVTAGDFIWMAPWCPQWFGAIGKVPAKYLIYKDWNRHPLSRVNENER